MTLTNIELFQAMTGKHENLKDCEGQVIKPVAFHTHEYEDAKGKEHQVLVIKDGITEKMYKTEVQAFIKKFMQYDEAFGSEPDENKPNIKIVIYKSKAGNNYVSFDVVQ